MDQVGEKEGLRRINETTRRVKRSYTPAERVAYGRAVNSLHLQVFDTAECDNISAPANAGGQDSAGSGSETPGRSETADE